MKAKANGTARSRRGRLRREVAVRVYLFVLLLAVSQQLPALDAFTHEAAEGNTFLHATIMDHPAINDDPNAIMVVTQVYNPDGNPSGIFNDDFVYVTYNDSDGRWAIHNANFAAMPEGAAFNVLVAEAGDVAFIHEAGSNNPVTVLDHPALNGEPDALFLVTPHRNPQGTSTPFVDDAIGVGYAGTDEWFIRSFTGSGSEDIPEGAAFNIIVPEQSGNLITHRVTSSNLSSGDSFSWIDLPAANGNLNAHVFLTHFLPNSAHVSLSAPFGILYDLFGAQWAVFREDESALSEDMYFIAFAPRTGPIFQDRFEAP